MVIIADYSQQHEFSIDELVEYLHLKADFMQELIEYGIVEPHGRAPNEWVFDALAIKRIQQAKRLHRDLQINLAGVAMILDLLDEIHDLRAHATLIERHILK